MLGVGVGALMLQELPWRLRLPNDGVALQATSPGKVLGSKAVYEKQIGACGKTNQYTKTTYDHQGNIAHVKDKLNGGVYQ